MSSSNDVDGKGEWNVKEGTRKGLEEFYQSLKQANEGYTPMAYHPGGGGVSRGGWFGSKEFPAINATGGGAFSNAQRDAIGGNADVPAGSSPRPSGLAANKRETAKIMTDELRRAGVSKEAIAGIMANLQDESRFNPMLRHPDQPNWSGEAHYTHQEGGGTDTPHGSAKTIQDPIAPTLALRPASSRRT
ncbi:phage tail tip lysozyme [Bradyrhizobium huanghuaihaiense]|uniref:phage tail tip lysozyme n=1 Tax=Bradyrhizobium huanghuaihaiense TaxID=990078 RepID=UPI0021AA478F|nr:phage tail tip lysozyme [Bradyrhizobium sp. CB3035]UWU75681.1 phage tail tip lysozyme [Bradyrhizobium sp. CB3035]